jgi:hypothetical protein
MRAGDWTVEYKRRVREFMQQNGRAVEHRDDSYGLQNVSVYGWCDYDAQRHIYDDKCAWIVPKGAQLEERTYSQFVGTFTDNAEEIGINVSPAHCACGRYTNRTLRHDGSLQDILAGILKIPTNPYIEL